MTDRYGVIGNPIAHSQSPLIHAEFARQTCEDIVYVRVLSPVAGFAAEVGRFRTQGGRGLNVTLPFKEEAYRLASLCSEPARAAKAVNTLRFDLTAVFGDNTDGVGLVRDICDNLGFGLEGRRVLLLGAGGAARGVIAPILSEHPAGFTVANRTIERATRLAEAFGAPVEASTYAGLSGRNFDAVINATSASLTGELPPLPRGVFAPGALGYDLAYGEVRSPFIERALSEGAALAADGLGMLVEQAAESFFIWRGVRPLTAPVLATLRNAPLP
jgi:shikimate dehydrogenase